MNTPPGSFEEINRSSTNGEVIMLVEGLSRALALHGSGPVLNLQRLSAGATQEIWSFDFGESEAPERMVLRRAPLAAPAGEFAIPLSLEAKVMERAAQAGVPVPRVRTVLRPELGLRDGYIMDWVAGETLPSRVMRRPDFAAARQGFAEQAGTILALLHRSSTDGLDLPAASPSNLVGKLDALYRASSNRRPVFDLALHWLEAHIPPPSEVCLVHGDFRNGNLMFGPDGIRAVLDWELAHLGHPVEDVAWLTINSWRFGAVDKPAGGIGELDPFLRAYERVSGSRVDPEVLRFWQVYGTLRWGVICAGMVRQIDSGLDRTPERAIIARRASETELDLLMLLVPREDRETHNG